jgi:hypothetical protein
MTRSLSNLTLIVVALVVILQLRVHTDLIDSHTAAAPLKYLQNAKQFIVREVLP